MHDPWIERLSEYIDGELDAHTRTAIEEHLAACDGCARTLAELRDVVAAAAAAPREVRPDADLWTGIAARIEGPAAAAPDPAIVRIDARPRGPRRYAFSAPQLAAAAILIVALSGAAAWYLAGRTEGTAIAGTLVHAAGAPPQSSQFVASPAATSDPELDRAISELERTLDEQRDALDPNTVEVIERSLAAIDDALREARAALDADPGNERLHRQLDTTLRRKLDVLRRAERITRAGA